MANKTREEKAISVHPATPISFAEMAIASVIERDIFNIKLNSIIIDCIFNCHGRSCKVIAHLELPPNSILSISLAKWN